MDDASISTYYEPSFFFVVDVIIIVHFFVVSNDAFVVIVVVQHDGVVATAIAVGQTKTRSTQSVCCLKNVESRNFF